jgi:TP901 family phage tail tape measure protein
MTGRDLKLGIEISTTGKTKTLGELIELEQQIKRGGLATEAANRAYAAAATATARLATSLGITQKNAREFATSIGLSVEKTGEAANRLGLLDRAGASTAEKFRALKSEFGLTKQAFESLNGSFNQNTQAQTRLAQSLNINLGAAQSFAKGLGLSAEKAGESVSRYRELTGVGASLAEKQRVLTQELGLSKSQFEAVSKAAATTQAGLAAVAAIAGGAAAGIGAIAGNGIKEFLEFDSTLRTFGVVSEASATQVAGVREEVERLGTSTTKTPKEVAVLGVELAKAGFKAEQTRDALGGIVLASQATGEDLQRTGEVVGNVINQFGLAAKDSANIADLLVATSNASASGVNDIGEALSYAGTAAAQSGQSLKDTLFAIGQLANAGIKGSSAGTGLAEALRRLKLASANASTELNDLKSKGAKGAVAAFNKINQAVRDANGQLLPLPQVLDNLKGGLAGVGQVDKDLIMNALFGVQGGRVVQTLISGNAEQVGNLQKALDNSSGAAKRAGDALSQGPAAAMQRLQAATSVALVAVGEVVSVAFAPMIDAGELLINTFNGLPAPVQATVVGITGFVGVLSAAVAAIAAYNLGNGAAIVSQTLAAAATVRDTAAKGASVAATVTAAIAQRALALANTTVTAATIGASIATAKSNAGRLLEAALTARQTAATALNTVARNANTASILANVGGLLKMAGVLGGAIVLLQELTTQTPVEKFTANVKSTTDALQKLGTEAAKKPTEKGLIENLNDSYSKFLANVQNKGAIEALRNVLADLDGQLRGGAGSASEYGDQWRFITREQQGNQAAQFALEEQFKVTNGQVDAGRALIEKYGVAQVDAADKARLGAAGIAEFKKAGEAQIATLEKSIELLKKQSESAQTDSQRQQIQTQITLLESNKKAIQSRAAALTQDANALKTATDAETLKNKALEDADKIKKSLAGGKISEEQAAADLEKIQASSAGKEAEVKKKVGEELNAIRQAQTEAEIATIQAGQSAIEALISNGKLSEADGERQLTALKIAEVEKRLAANRAEQESATGSSKKKLVAEEKKLAADIEKIRGDSAKRLQQLQIAEIERTAQQGQAKAVEAESARQIEIQKLINAGVIDQKKAEDLKASATSDRLKKELALNQQTIAKLNALPTPGNPEAARDLEAKKQAARKATTDLTLQLLQAEAAAQERVRQAAIAAIEQELAAKNRGFDAELGKLAAVKAARERSTKAAELAAGKELAALGAAERSLTRQNNLLQAKSALSKAVGDLQQFETQTKIDQTEDPAKKAQLQQQLNQQQRNALLQQQAQERAGLLIEQQRTALAQRRALIEAQIAEVKAKQGVLDAQAAVTQQRITDQKAIEAAKAELAKAAQLAPGADQQKAQADAQARLALAQQEATTNQANAAQGVQLAQQQAEFAAQNVAAVKSEAADQLQINALQNQTLLATQALALRQLDVAAAAEREAAARERSAKAAEAIQPATPAALPTRRGGGGMGAGIPFEGAEAGPEAVRYADGSYGLLPTRGIYQLPQRGTVITAPRTAAMMRSPTISAAAMKAPSSSTDGLIKEVRELKAELKRVQSPVNNTFQIKTDDDPYGRMARIAATVNRSRWR